MCHERFIMPLSERRGINFIKIKAPALASIPWNMRQSEAVWGDWLAFWDRVGSKKGLPASNHNSWIVITRKSLRENFCVYKIKAKVNHNNCFRVEAINGREGRGPKTSVSDSNLRALGHLSTRTFSSYYRCMKTSKQIFEANMSPTQAKQVVRNILTAVDINFYHRHILIAFRAPFNDRNPYATNVGLH